MSAPDFPWIVPAIREVLLADSAFSALVGGRISSRLPALVPGPTVKLSATAIPVNVPAGVWSPLVQVDVYVPPTSDGDPEDIAWSVVAKSAGVLSTVRNRPFENMHFSAEVIDGPILDVDKSRGDSNPLYRGIIRAELLVHAR